MIVYARINNLSAWKDIMIRQTGCEWRFSEDPDPAIDIKESWPLLEDDAQIAEADKRLIDLVRPNGRAAPTPTVWPQLCFIDLS